jgi:hypothetical protein
MKNLFYSLFAFLFCCQTMAQTSEWKCLYKGLNFSNALCSEEKIWFSAERMGLFSVQKDGTETQLFMPGLTSIPAAISYELIKDSPNSYVLITDYNRIWDFDGENISIIPLPNLPQGFVLSSAGALKNEEGIGVGFYNYTTQVLQIWKYHQGIWTNITSNFGTYKQLILPNGVTWKENTAHDLLKIQVGNNETFLLPDSIKVYRVGASAYNITSLTPLQLLPDGSVLLKVGYVGTVGGCGSEVDFSFDRYLIFSPQTLKWRWVGLDLSFYQTVIFGEDGKVYYQHGGYLTQIIGETESIIQLPDAIGNDAKLLAADAVGQFWFSDTENDLIRIASDGAVQKFGRIQNADVPSKNNMKTVHAIPNSHRMWLAGDSLYLFDQTLSQKYFNQPFRSMCFDQNNNPFLDALDGFQGNAQSNFYTLQDNQFINANIKGYNPVFISNQPKVWFLKNAKIHRQTIGISDEETLPNAQENFPDFEFTALESDKTGQLYALTSDNNLYKRNTYNQWILMNIPWFLKSYNYLKIMIDGKNRLNLRNIDGWYRLNGSNWESVPLSAEVAAIFEQNPISDFTFENDSISWASTLRGLYKITENQVELVHPLGINDANYYNECYSVAVDSLGTKWVTTSAFGLLAFHENGIVLSENEVKNESPEILNAVQIFPQPNNGVFQVKCPSSQNKSGLWRVFSSSGLLTQEKNINATQFEADLGNIATGVYYYFLQTEDGVFNGKILVGK